MPCTQPLPMFTSDYSASGTPLSGPPFGSYKSIRTRLDGRRGGASGKRSILYVKMEGGEEPVSDAIGKTSLKRARESFILVAPNALK